MKNKQHAQKGMKIMLSEIVKKYKPKSIIIITLKFDTALPPFLSRTFISDTNLKPLLMGNLNMDM